jgi:sugar phosphate isomerase/epimerase
MDLVARAGGTLIAAPPMGATDITGLDLFRAAERYAQLCEVGREFGVRPLVEVWGFSKTLSRLGEATFVAVESGHPDACILADVYHLHKGGSPHQGLALLNGDKLPLFHVNDYPAAPGRETIKDEERVWPGDGVAPLHDIFSTLQSIGFDGYLSLELFNPNYWNGDAFATAQTGAQKLKAVVENFKQS